MVPAWAADLPQEVTDAAPPAAEELEGKDFSGGVTALLEQGTTLLGEALRGNLRGAVLILGVVLLCGAADAVLRTPESPMRRFLPMAGAAAIAALAVSLLTAMLPKGETIRRIAGLAGGLILLLAVVQPLLRVRWEELTWRYETYQREMDRQTEAYQAAYADSLSGDIADRTAAYISEKAASLGIDCRVQVEVRTEDGLPLPYGASLDVERDQVLSDYMAQELGIPASRQSWQPEE